MNLKGTKSADNIMAAFAGESQARNKYTFFAEKAREEGKEDIALMFDKMAKNEMAHAKIWFHMMDVIADTERNVMEAAGGENSEWRSMYPTFAAEALEEGFDELADMFNHVAAIEQDHERTFLKTLIAMKKGTPIQPQAPSEKQAAGGKIVYQCLFCGAKFEDRPDVCAVCGAIGSFEQLFEDA